MPRRGENVYKRKDGRWEGRILQSDSKYQYMYAKSYKELKEKMKNHKQQKRLCKKPLTDEQATATELFELWLDSVYSQIKPSTYENYFNCINKYIIPYFSSAGNNSLSKLTVAKFVKCIKENGDLSESYKRKILSIFKTALRDMLKGREDYSAIVEVVSLPKVEHNVVEVFSVREQRLLESAVMMSKDKRALGILLCIYTGIRLGELCALKWGDIDLEAGTMSITRTVSRTKLFQEGGNKTALLIGTPKSQKSLRKIPLPSFLLKICEGYKEMYDYENNYILTRGNAPIDPRTYQKLYKRILRKAGVKDRKFHAIRHTFATRALELGVDIKTLSEILGHSNVSITLNIYAHSLMEQKKIAMDKFNDLHITHMKEDSFVVTDSVIFI